MSSLSPFLFFFLILPAFVAAGALLLANGAPKLTVVHTATAEAKPDSTSIAATVESMIAKSGLKLKGDVSELVKELMSQDLNPKTLRAMLLSLFGEIPDKQQDAFASLCAKLTGLYVKKNKLTKEMIATFANGTGEAEKMRTYMRTMNVNAIVSEVNRTFGGQKEWRRIKNFVAEINGNGGGKKEHNNHHEEPDVQVDPIFTVEEPETGGFDPIPEDQVHIDPVPTNFTDEINDVPAVQSALGQV